jgi:hypothetical protein
MQFSYQTFYMSGDSRRKGGGKKNQSGGREKNAMSKTDKTGNSADFDGHLSDEDKLRQDALKQQQEHMDKVRVRQGRPAKFGDKEDTEETKPITLTNEQDDRKHLLTDDPKLIVGLRIYSLNQEGNPYGTSANTEKFIAKHRQIRRERNRYLDQDGSHVEAGKWIRDRKGRDVEAPKMLGGDREKARRAPAVVKSIMVRAMPHEAMIAAGELTGEALDAAMDQAVREFQAATGCDIISAAAHRMSDHDLHIHIQYTMVVAEQKKLGKYSEPVLEWNKEASRLAREALSAAGVDEPNPSAIGAMKKKLVKEGKLHPSPETKIVYRKVKPLRPMGNGCILGHSFRNKINLVRLAQSAGLRALGERVIAKKDNLRGFAPIASTKDEELESLYLDLWLERIWRKAVTGQLKEDTLERIREAGIKLVNDYNEYGTSMPDAYDLEKRKVELQHEAAENELERQFLEYDHDRYRMQLEEAAQTKENELKAQEKFLDEREGRIREYEQIIQDGLESFASNQRLAESLQLEVNKLSEKANLCDRLIEFLRKLIDIPGLGKHLSKIAAAWVPLKKLGPELGIVTKLEAIEAIRSSPPEPTQPGDNKPGKIG